jgi:hypothetical protein
MTLGKREVDRPRGECRGVEVRRDEKKEGDGRGERGMISRAGILTSQ